MRILAVGDSDSYVKWGAAVLERMPEEWSRSLVLLATPALPSPDQLVSALAGTRFSSDDVPTLELAELADRVMVERPDVVLLSTRGPVVRVVVRAIVARGGKRPVFISGIPGISVPATRKALGYRSQVDVMIVHSHRERRGFAAVAERIGVDQSFGLATLSYLPPVQPARAPGSDIIFAAQAKVPRSLEDRQSVVGWLVETARRHPELRVVLKLRAVAGEQQTHSEKYPFDVLLGEIDNLPDNLVVAGGPMAGHLDRAAGLVTVSSSAALEAAALGVPVLVLNDFGVNARMINFVFRGSGLVGSSQDLLDANFFTADPEWLEDNYFHGARDDDWLAVLDGALQRRAAGEFPLRRQYRGTLGGRVRQAWDRKRALGDYDRTLSGTLVLAVGIPSRWVVVRMRGAVSRVRRRVRRRARAAAAVREAQLAVAE